MMELAAAKAAAAKATGLTLEAAPKAPDGYGLGLPRYAVDGRPFGGSIVYGQLSAPLNQSPLTSLLQASALEQAAVVGGGPGFGR